MIPKLSEKEGIPISSRKYLLWIVVIAISIRLLCMLIFQSWEFKSNRQFGYEAGEIGSALAAGLGFSWPNDSTYNPGKPPEPTSHWPPAYPLIIATVFKAFGTYSTASAVVLMIFQTIMSALSCVLLFFVGRRIFNAWVGLLAALTLALYPSDLHFAALKIGSTNLYVVLLLLFILQFFELAKAPTLKKSILAGVTFGIATLTVPTIVAFLPFALGWLFVRGRAERKTRIISIAIVFLAMCTTISPWEIRNYLVFDRFIFIKSNLNREFFMGNYGTIASLIEERQSLRTLDEGQRSKFYEKKALDSILNNPARLARRTSIRFVRYWTVTPRDGGPRAKKRGMKDQVAGISYLIILSLGTAGLCLTLLRGREVQLLVMAILSLPIPYYLTWFTRFRYRFPVEPILIVFAGYAMYQFLKLVNGNRACSSRSHYLLKDG